MNINFESGQVMPLTYDVISDFQFRIFKIRWVPIGYEWPFRNKGEEQFIKVEDSHPSEQTRIG